MEEPHSVSSPRRILSFSKNKRASLLFSDSEHRSSDVGISGEQGPKTSEVYGFVGSITTVVATVIFLIWAYVPDPWLHAVGIHYYPSSWISEDVTRTKFHTTWYWALAMPAYVMVTMVLALLFYIGFNFMATPPPTSSNTLFDEFSREPSIPDHLAAQHELPIEPISDIGIDEINSRMFT